MKNKLRKKKELLKTILTPKQPSFQKSLFFKPYQTNLANIECIFTTQS